MVSCLSSSPLYFMAFALKTCFFTKLHTWLCTSTHLLRIPRYSVSWETQESRCVFVWALLLWEGRAVNGGLHPHPFLSLLTAIWAQATQTDSPKGRMKGSVLALSPAAWGPILLATHVYARDPAPWPSATTLPRLPVKGKDLEYLSLYPGQALPL